MAGRAVSYTHLDVYKRQEVETGLTSDSYVQILSGLSEGDVIYVSESSKNNASMFQMGVMLSLIHI